MSRRHRKGRKRRQNKPIEIVPTLSAKDLHQEVVLEFRKDKDLTPNKRILILCEGETEVEYFEKLKLCDGGGLDFGAARQNRKDVLLGMEPAI
ncbi:MAG: hypothetical protein AB8B69_18780 [Chitinophagales bacterium]